MSFKKFVTFKNEINNDGSVRFQKSLFDQPFGDKPGELKVLPNKYRLLWMPACPHAHKVVIVRKLLGLDSVISLGATGPYRTPDPHSWVFSNDPDGKDSVLGVKSIGEVYLNADPTYKGRPTVPVIVDIETKKAVNNDHIWLTIQLETAWKAYHKPDAPDLYPEEHQAEINRWTKIIYEEINAGVYDVGFAHTQEAYEKAYDRLFARLDELEQHLSDKKYFFGDQLTDVDVRLYPTLVRFDLVYYQLFRANKRRIKDYPHLWAYARRLYQIPAFRESTDFEFIKDSYYRSLHLRKLFGNEYNRLPKGPSLDEWDYSDDTDEI
ncbi:glutathione S-transferase C-terminal domain-containing protein [Enterococcus olivae]